MDSQKYGKSCITIIPKCKPQIYIILADAADIILHDISTAALSAGLIYESKLSLNPLEHTQKNIYLKMTLLSCSITVLMCDLSKL